MANIKGLVSISTIIACYHINGDLCGDSCKVSDISSIEFENFEKLTGDTRDKVIEAIFKTTNVNVAEMGQIKEKCIVFKNTNIQPQCEFYIFLFNEEIYKAQKDDRIKKCIKQLDNKKIFLIVGVMPHNINNGLRKQPIPANQYQISKVNSNKYKFESQMLGVGGNQTGTRIPYGRGNLNGMGSFGGMATGMSTRTGMSGGFPSMSQPGTQSSPFVETTTNNNDCDDYNTDLNL